MLRQLMKYYFWTKILVAKKLPESIHELEAEFKEFKSRLISAKTRFKLSAGSNLETFDTIISETNHN